MDEPVPVMKDVDEEQQLEQQSSSPGVPLHPQANAKADSYTAFFGKHRMAAAISNLHNQINMIQEELEQLETLGNSSIVCKELISSLDSVRDPLLPSTVGPADVSWDRWFRGAHNSRNHKRWI
ncbi:guanine nucleotide-binding protein subunit gamma 2-like [Carya illinoinensis]|uniref:G protein gamma domain-containing protein n=1 Tax=Carya illinoinensis TaxID=32201 RepID=A0A8T1PHD6_CARIL|nr:guanine nucleotide-binding protein subunit gamma 2-like [Carya illinoinensis]KAG6643886.1 hypothetical protein CIPAW_08G017400 [Carya illinoinensis]